MNHSFFVKTSRETNTLPCKFAHFPTNCRSENRLSFPFPSGQIRKPLDPLFPDDRPDNFSRMMEQEAAFFLDPAGRSVLRKADAPQTGIAKIDERPTDQCARHLRGEAHVPVRFRDPVPDLPFSRAHRRRPFRKRHDAGAPHQRPACLQRHRPGLRLGKHRTDDLLTFLDALVGVPPRHRTDVGVACRLIQILCVFHPPMAEFQPLRHQSHVTSSPARSRSSTRPDR